MPTGLPIGKYDIEIIIVELSNGNVADKATTTIEIIPQGSNTTQSILIIEPSATAPPFKEHEAIKLSFETTNLAKPYVYRVYAVPVSPTAGSTIILIDRKQVDETVNDGNTRTDTIPPLISQGKYTLVVEYKNNLMSDSAIAERQIVIGPGAKPSASDITIVSLIKEIRKDIESGIINSKKEIENKLRDSLGNANLKPYLMELKKVINAQTPTEMKKEAEKIIGKDNTTTIIRTICVAIINRVNELEYYEALYNVFNVSKHPENDYIKILKEYEHHAKALNTQLDKLNKTDQRIINGVIERRMPQNEAKKIVAKIDTALNLLNSKPSHNP
jgi:hypothetical protein